MRRINKFNNTLTEIAREMYQRITECFPILRARVWIIYTYGSAR